MKHIILLFLSPVSGTEARYRDIEREDIPTKTTNESAVRWLIKHEFGGDADKISRIFVLASKKVRKPIAPDNPKTHPEYFKDCLRAFISNIDACIPEEAIYNYDEDGADDQNLISVAEMAGTVQKFAASVGDEVTLHVDMTGGMRHINMMMLDVIRLLEYSGITIKHILYSNLQRGREIQSVEPVKNIYDLFQLISGVEEFVQFGSVKALDKYYEHQSGLSSDLKNLIAAMKNFAEQVKLCHYGQLKDAIRQLHKAVHDFEPDESNAQDLLMARLIERIREMYAATIKYADRIDDVELIQWCLDNDYVQQALTFYTERVPEYLGAHGLITQSPEESAKLDELLKADVRNRWFYLLNESPSSFSGDNKKIMEGSRFYCNMIKRVALLDIRKNRFDYAAWRRALDERLTALDLKCADEPRLRTQFELLVALRNDPTPLLTPDEPTLVRAGFENVPEANRRFKRLCQFISDVPNNELTEFLPSLVAPPTYVGAFKKMLDAGIFDITIDKNKFLDIMDHYFRLKNERNHTNHARADRGEFDNTADLKIFIKEGLDGLKSVMKADE